MLREETMNIIRSLYLSYFSSPPENRALYQAICRWKPARIVEFGIQRGVRTANMLELVRQFHEVEKIEYFCVDPFESRVVEDGPGLSLRKAHKLFVQSGVRVKPVPGRPEDGLRSLTKQISDVDLLIIATPSPNWIEMQKPALAELLKPKAQVFIGTSTLDGSPFELHAYTLQQLMAFLPSCRRAA